MVTINDLPKYIRGILRTLFETLEKSRTIPAMMYIIEIGLEPKTVGGL